MQCLSTALAENFKPPNNYILNPLGVKTLFVPEKLADDDAHQNKKCNDGFCQIFSLKNKN